MRVLFNQGNILQCKEITDAYYDKARKELMLCGHKNTHHLPCTEDVANNALVNLLTVGYCDLSAISSNHNI